MKQGLAIQFVCLLKIIRKFYLNVSSIYRAESRMFVLLSKTSQDLLILFHNSYSLLVQETTEIKQDMLITPTVINYESQREFSTLPDGI